MAKMEIKGLTEYANMLDKLGANAPEITKKVVYTGAGVVADEIKKRLQENLNDPAYVGKGSGELGVKSTMLSGRQGQTGDLLASFGVSPIQVDRDGNTNAKIGFEGYDSKGVPNALKARAMESGTSKLKARPFVRPTVNAVKGKVQQVMGKKLEEEISKIYAR